MFTPEFTQVINNIAPLFVLVLVGVVVSRLRILPPEAPPLINRLVMTLTLPALVFSSIRRTAAGSSAEGLDLLKVPLVAWLVILACWGLAWLAARALRLDRAATGTLIISSMFGSTAFLGYPVVAALRSSGQLGPDGELGHVLYSELGTLVALVTLGLLISAQYGEGAGLSWRSLLAIPRAAPFIALLLGLLFYRDPLPEWSLNLVDLMARATSFLMMLYLGMSLTGSGLLAHLRPTLAVHGIKLLAAPLLALGLALLLGMSADLRKVVVLDSSMPSILLSLAYAAQYKLDQKLAIAAVFSSFIFSLITIFFWLAVGR